MLCLPMEAMGKYQMLHNAYHTARLWELRNSSGSTRAILSLGLQHKAVMCVPQYKEMMPFLNEPFLLCFRNR